MPRHLISDAHEWINEIPTVPMYYLANPLPRERQKTLEHRYSYYSVGAVEPEMKRVRKDQVNSIENVSYPPSIWSDRNRVSCKKDPVHIEMRMVPKRIEEQRYRCNIEAVFHIEHMSQDRYRDPDYRVKKRKEGEYNPHPGSRPKEEFRRIS